jgi:hypothetical protein
LSIPILNNEFVECDDQNIANSVENSKPAKEIGRVEIMCMCVHVHVRVREVGERG